MDSTVKNKLPMVCISFLCTCVTMDLHSVVEFNALFMLIGICNTSDAMKNASLPIVDWEMFRALSTV